MSDENTIETKTEKPKNQEITFESFLDLLKSRMELKEGKAIPQVFQIVKKGFTGEFNKDQVDTVFNLFKTWKFVDLLAIKLINEENNGKLRPFGRQLINRIRFDFIHEYNYPTPTNGASVSRDEIFDWIRNGFRAPTEKPVESREVQDVLEKTPPSKLLDKRLRIMFICLSNNLKDEFIYEAINYLLSEYFDNSGKKFRISKNSYINAINKALTVRNPAVLVENILVSSAPFKEIAQTARESENDLWRKNQSLQAKIQQLESNELSLKDKLQEAAKENHSLNEQLSSKTRALEEWKAENKNLDQHWQELSKQKLTKQAGDTKRRIQNQLTEIKLSLENQPPDTEIALLLLQRIEKILGDSELDGK
jgi:hypothetical protein